MPKTHVPFRLVTRLKTPVVLAEISPALDGLVFEALQQKHCDKTESDIIEEMKSLLAFNKKLGVFHAGALRFGVTAEQGVTARNYVRVDSMREDKITASLYKPKAKAGGGYTKVNLGGGRTKRRMRQMRSYAAPHAVFEGMGDPHSIQSLLEFFFVGVGYDALSCECGAFDEITVIPMNEDESIYLQGSANRVIPFDKRIKGRNIPVKLIPPYFSGERVDGTAPEAFRIVPVSTLFS